MGTTRGVIRNHLMLGATSEAEKHDCKKSLNKTFSSESAKYECDLLYTFDYENRCRRLYKVIGKLEDNNLIKCKEIKTSPFIDPNFAIDCSPFGLYVNEYTHDEVLIINLSDFDGRVVTRKLFCGPDKVLKCVLITLPYYWLFCYK